MEAFTYDEFSSTGVVPFVDVNDIEAFDAANVRGTGLPDLVSICFPSSSSPEPSTTCSAEYFACSVASTPSDKETQLEHGGNQEDAATSILEEMQTNGDEGLPNNMKSSLVSDSVEGRLILKPAYADLANDRFDSDGSLAWQNAHRDGLVASSSSWSSMSAQIAYLHLEDLLRLESRECLDSRFQLSGGVSFPSDESSKDRVDDLLQDIPCPLRASQPVPETDEEPLENVSHVFARWLQNNSHRFSLSDIRKIKLKTSTVENGMRRLGGGKKGLLYFLKLVLTWIQAQHGEQRHAKIAGLAFKADSMTVKELIHEPARRGNELMEGSQRALAVALKDGVDVKENDNICRSIQSNEEQFTDFPHRDNPNTAAVAQSEGVTFSAPACSTHNSTVPFQVNWNLSASRNDEWSQQRTFGQSALINASNGMSHTATNTNLPLIANVGNTGGQWIETMAAGSTLQEPLCLQTNRISSKSGHYSSTSFAFDPTAPDTSAATTRAARMSRMERRKWSVQRNRKWSRGPLGV